MVVLLPLVNINLSAQTIRGDVNGDNQVTTEDFNPIVSYIMGNTDISKDAADVNRDWAVTVADICTVVNIIDDRKKISQALASGSSEEVTAMLEELSGTDRLDANAAAAVLQNNTDVEETVSDDGSNLVVKMKNSGCHIVYPLYEAAGIISDYDASLEDIQAALVRNKARHQGDVYNGKVAIFNHFSGIPGYSFQNRLVSNIKVMFELNGYDVAFYGTNPSNEYNGNIDYEQYFDHEHLADVIDHSDEYDAILIFSHGYEQNGKTFFATGEKLKTAPGEEWYIYEKEDGEYYFNYPVEALKTNNKCIVYLGSCFGIPSSGLGNYSFINEKNSCIIGWNGKNRIAQADAMLLFNYMVIHGLTLDQAINCTYKKDPWNADTQRCTYNTASHSLEGSLRPNYVEDKLLKIETTKKLYRKEDNKTYIELSVKAQGNWTFPAYIRISIESMLYGDSNPLYEGFEGFIFNNYKEQVAHLVLDESSTEEDLYNVCAEALINGEWQRIRLASPRSFLYSGTLSDNYSAPVPSESDIRKPVVRDLDGQVVEEIRLVAGSTKPYAYDICSGHYSFTIRSLDESICTASRYASRVMVTGVSEGTSYFCILDDYNNQMSVVKVVVMPESSVPYSSCPDNSHPHMIDLGLPSGTLWACCNVGASKPEGYGGYYAWGETEEKEDYGIGTSKYINSLYHDISGTEDDVAYVKWGSSWQMPTKNDFSEIDDYCAKKMITYDDVKGMVFIGDNGNSIFMPFSGLYSNYSGKKLSSVNEIGFYWGGTIDGTNRFGATSVEYWISESISTTDVRSAYRDSGCTVRPVSK